MSASVSPEMKKEGGAVHQLADLVSKKTAAYDPTKTG